MNLQPDSMILLTIYLGVVGSMSGILGQEEESEEYCSSCSIFKMIVSLLFGNATQKANEEVCRR
jgi:hypothetical protein